VVWYGAEGAELRNASPIEGAVDIGPTAEVFYEYGEARSMEVICGRQGISCRGVVADLEEEATEPISQRMGRAVVFSAAMKVEVVQLCHHALYLSEEIKAIHQNPLGTRWLLTLALAHIQGTLAPCDALVKRDLARFVEVGGGVTFEPVLCYGGVQGSLYVLEQKMREVEQNIHFSQEASVDAFEAARLQMSIAHMHYRAISDIGEIPMIVHADQLVHHLSQVFGTLGRSLASGEMQHEPHYSGPQDLPAYVGGSQATSFDAGYAEEVRGQLRAIQGPANSPTPELCEAMRAWAEPLAFMTCNAAHAIRNAMRLWGCMVEPNYDGGSDTKNGNGGSVGTVQGIQGKLLQYFVSADGNFGTVEGQMRNLVELLRVSPNAMHEGLAEDRIKTAHRQFDIARQVFGGAQTEVPCHPIPS
jgi:hypothetical protein